MRYANCWEDAEILLNSFKDRINPTILSIGSAGDNSLSLLTLDPEVVYVLDYSIEQLFLINLKINAIKYLKYEELLGFLGFKDEKNRIEIYNNLKTNLTKEEVDFWDKNKKFIKKGVIHCGKFEKYFQIFRKFILPFILSKKDINYLLQEKSIVKQKEFYDKKFNGVLWHSLFKLFFNKKTMGTLGRDKDFFKYTTGNIEENIFTRARYALTELSTSSNPYLEYISTGNFSKNLPHYLKFVNYLTIKANISKIKLSHGKIDEFLSNNETKYDCFNLSDIFEYMSIDEYNKNLELIIEKSNKNAKMVYWNMQVDRMSNNKNINYLKDLSLQLFAKDRAFFYKRLIVEEIIKTEEIE